MRASTTLSAVDHVTKAARRHAHRRRKRIGNEHAPHDGAAGLGDTDVVPSFAFSVGTVGRFVTDFRSRGYPAKSRVTFFLGPENQESPSMAATKKTAAAKKPAAKSTKKKGKK
jgi:hypothetical protein